MLKFAYCAMYIIYWFADKRSFILSTSLHFTRADNCTSNWWQPISSRRIHYKHHFTHREIAIVNCARLIHFAAILFNFAPTPRFQTAIPHSRNQTLYTTVRDPTRRNNNNNKNDHYINIQRDETRARWVSKYYRFVCCALFEKCWLVIALNCRLSTWDMADPDQYACIDR